ncbi:hypothetical protein EC01304_1959, partial [Escherichia coli 0.1304]
MVRAEWGQNL